MCWRSDWALLDKVWTSSRHVWYRFQYKDGTPRCIIADGRRNTIEEITAMLDRAESERETKRVDGLL